jgi:hypothetical protein
MTETEIQSASQAQQNPRLLLRNVRALVARGRRGGDRVVVVVVRMSSNILTILSFIFFAVYTWYIKRVRFSGVGVLNTVFLSMLEKAEEFDGWKCARLD